jgi:hypothetical protein
LVADRRSGWIGAGRQIQTDDAEEPRELDDRDRTDQTSFNPADLCVRESDRSADELLAESVFDSGLAELPTKFPDHLGSPPGASIDDPFPGRHAPDRGRGRLSLNARPLTGQPPSS